MEANFETLELQTFLKEQLAKAFPKVKVSYLSDDEMQLRFGVEPAIATEEILLTDIESVQHEIDDKEEGLPISTISDFGEKIGGARKDLYSQYVAKINLQDKNDEELLKLSKSEIIPEIDYKKIKEDFPDFPEYLLAYTKNLYINLGQKPRATKYNSYKTVLWIKKVREVSSILNSIFSNATSQEWLKTFAENLRNDEYKLELKDRILIKFYIKTEFWNKSKFNTLFVTKNLRFSVDKRANQDEQFYIRDYKNQISTRVGTIESALDFLESAFSEIIYPTSTKTKQQSKVKKSYKFGIWTYTGGMSFFGLKHKGEYIKLVESRNVEELRKIKYDPLKIEEYTKIVEEMLSPIAERGGENTERLGDKYLNENVTPELYQQTFGFRGVEFGNYLNNKDRQKMLNLSYEAFHDLAKALNIPVKALSLNGTLAMAFGARGRGGKNSAMAHYEPNRKVINLTKLKGAGSLAHEWWHALDNYLGIKGKGWSSGFSTLGDFDKSLVEGREELHQKLKDFKSILKDGTQIVKRSLEVDKLMAKKQLYFSTPEEMSARSFEFYVKTKLHEDNITNDFLVNFYSENAISEKQKFKYPYPLELEKPLVIRYFDELMDIIEYKVDNNNIMLYHADKNRILGHSTNKEIFFNENFLTKTTLIHEYSHLWIKSLKILNPTLYKKGIELVENFGEEYIENIKSIHFYNDLSDEQILEEALVTAIGERGNKILDEGRSFFSIFLDRIKVFIGDTFFYDNKKNIEKLSFDEFLDSSVYDLLQGHNLKLDEKREKQDVMEENINDESLENNIHVKDFKNFADKYIGFVESKNNKELESFENVIAFYCDLNDMDAEMYLRNLKNATNDGRVMSKISNTAIYFTLPINTENKQNIERMENKLSFLDQYITPRTSGYKKFVYELETKSPEDFYQDGERVLTNEERKYIHIYETLNSNKIVMEVKYEISNVENDHVVGIKGFEDLAITLKHLEGFQYNDSHTCVLRDVVNKKEFALDTPVQLYKFLSDIWAKEGSKRSDLSQGMSLDLIDEKQAYYFRVYEVESRKAGTEVNPNMEYELEISRNYNVLTREEALDIIPAERWADDDLGAINVSKEEAEHLIANGYVMEVMNAEYGDVPDHWVGMTEDDFNEEGNFFDADYQTFQIWVNPYFKSELENVRKGIEEYAKLPEFEINILENLEEKVKVKAVNEQEAKKIVEQKHESQYFVLDSSNHNSTDILEKNEVDENKDRLNLSAPAKQISDAGDLAFKYSFYNSEVGGNGEEITILNADFNTIENLIKVLSFAAIGNMRLDVDVNGVQVLLQKDDYLKNIDYLKKEVEKVNESLYQEIDLFEHRYLIPDLLKPTLDRWSNILIDEGFDYARCEDCLTEFEALGFTFDYDLSPELMYLRPKAYSAQLELRDTIRELKNNINTEIIGGKIKDIASEAIKDPESLKQFDNYTQNVVNEYIENENVVAKTLGDWLLRHENGNLDIATLEFIQDGDFDVFHYDFSQEIDLLKEISSMPYDAVDDELKYSIAAKVELKSGLMLEGLGLMDKGTTIKNLQEQGWKKPMDLLNTIQTNINNQNPSEEKIIGKIIFHDSGEVMEYTSAENYLNALKNEYETNPIGAFSNETLTNDPELIQNIKNLQLGIYGIDNTNQINTKNSEIMEQNQEPRQEQVNFKKPFINSTPGSELLHMEMNLMLARHNKGAVVNFLKEHFSPDVVTQVRDSEFKYLTKESPLLKRMQEEVKDSMNFKPRLGYKHKEIVALDIREGLNNNFVFEAIKDNKISLSHVNILIEKVPKDEVLSILSDLNVPQKIQDTFAKVFANEEIKDLLNFPSKEYQLEEAFIDAKRFLMNSTNMSVDRVNDYMNAVFPKLEMAKEQEQNNENDQEIKR